MLRHGGQQDGAGRLFEVTARDCRVRVVRGDDLALFRQLEPTVHRSRGKSKDRPVRRASPATDRPAAAVEDRQLHTTRPRNLDHRRLGSLEHPRGGQQARFLVRVRVAKHDFLAIAATDEPRPVRRVVKEVRQDLPGFPNAALDSNSGTTSRTGGRPRFDRRPAGASSSTSVTSDADDVKLTTYRRQLPRQSGPGSTRSPGRWPGPRPSSHPARPPPRRPRRPEPQ